MRRVFFLLFMIGLVILVDVRSSPGADSPPDAEKLKKFRERLETIRMWRLTETLSLSEEKAAKLFPLLHKYSAERRGFFKKQGEVMRGLQGLLKEGTPNNQKIEELLTEYEQTQEKLLAIQGQENKELKELLSRREQAQYILFQQDFRREVGELLMRSRKGEKRDNLLGGTSPDD